MLIVISTFALDFIHNRPKHFQDVDLDEAWSFLQVAQGKTLSMKLVRAGRAMNAGVYSRDPKIQTTSLRWKTEKITSA